MAPREAQQFYTIPEPLPPRPVEVVVDPNVPQQELILGDRPQSVCTNNHRFPQERDDECEACQRLDGSEWIQLTQRQFEILRMIRELPEEVRDRILASVVDFE